MFCILKHIYKRTRKCTHTQQHKLPIDRGGRDTSLPSSRNAHLRIIQKFVELFYRLGGRTRRYWENKMKVKEQNTRRGLGISDAKHTHTKKHAHPNWYPLAGVTIPGRLKRRVRCLSNLCWRRQLSKWSAGEPKWNRWTLLFHISFPAHSAHSPSARIPSDACRDAPAFPAGFSIPNAARLFFFAQGRSAGEQSEKYSTNSAQIWPKGNILSIPISSEDEKKLSRNNKKRTTKGGSSSSKTNPPKRGPSIFLFFFFALSSSSSSTVNSQWDTLQENGRRRHRYGKRRCAADCRSIREIYMYWKNRERESNKKTVIKVQSDC